MPRKGTAYSVNPIGQNSREAAARRRASDPKYAELEKKHDVALAIADLVILHRTRSGLTQEDLAFEWARASRRFRAWNPAFTFHRSTRCES